MVSMSGENYLLGFRIGRGSGLGVGLIISLMESPCGRIPLRGESGDREGPFIRRRMGFMGDGGYSKY